MSPTDQVTLCIPTYNCKDFVLETLQSIKKQKYKNIKIKIFDNNSTDGTTELLKKSKNTFLPFELITSEVNLGGEGNFTRCIKAAEGKYTALFHADDVYSSEIVSQAVDAMTLDNEVVAVSFHAKIIDKNGTEIGERFTPPEFKNKTKILLDQKTLFKLSLKYGNFITCPSVVARTDVYLNHIQTWDGTQFKSSADLDVWFRMTEKGKILFINKPLMSYRESTASFSYNLFKHRTQSHDLFLVLDRLVSDNKDQLNSKDIHNYNFLKFKDQSLRTFNIIRNFSIEPYPTQSFSFVEILKTGLQSQFHIKFLMIGLTLYFLKLVFPVWLRKLLSKLKK